MAEISRRAVLGVLGGGALAAALPAVAACSSDDDGGGEASAVTAVDEPIELTVPEGWSYPTLEGSTLPFGHAVASGDPGADRVVLWTRLTIPDPPADGIEAAEVSWAIATDEGLADVVAEGTARTDATFDWTVKVDATGLEPGTTYHYGFTALGAASPVGRTQTAPASVGDGITFAAVSCSSYWSGRFNAYARIAERDEVDLVVHLGDHVYDDPDPDEWVRAADDRFDPEHVDFRVWESVEECGRRYALHFADADAAALRTAKPMTIVWDNHDLSTADGALPLEDVEAVFWRWTPSRPPEPATVDGQVVAGDPGLEHRRLPYGEVDLFLLDAETRQDDVSLLGEAQRGWLEEEMASSAEQGRPWRVVLSPKPVGALDIGGSSVYPGWGDRDGDRAHLLAHLADTGTSDNVFISGDAHGAFAWDLPADQGPDGYDPATGEGSAGVEVQCNSVSRGGADERIAGEEYRAQHGGRPPEADREAFEPMLADAAPLAEVTAATLVAQNPSLHHASWVDHGYALVTLTTSEAVIESWLVPHLVEADEQRLDVRLRTEAGADHLVAET